MRAAVYCRISQDRFGAGLGVKRQREDAERLVAERGWSATVVYEDNDISAYSGKTRPGYRQLLADIDAGAIDVVVTWHTDRLHRSPLELEEYIALCEQRNVGTVTVRAGELDLSSAAGRMVARMLGAAARHESEQKAERVRRARQQEAMAGKVHGSLGYGWRKRDDQWTIEQSEAEIIREIAQRLLDGENYNSVARELNDRGVASPGGEQGAWRGGNIRMMITAGRFCGWREWTPAEERGARGRGRGMGELVALGEWPAILSIGTTERLRILARERAKTSLNSGRRPGRLVHLLTGGLARCGRCGAGLHISAASMTGKGRRIRSYVCIARVGSKNCGRLAISADTLDSFVRDAALQALTGATYAEKADTNSDASESDEVLRAMRGRLDELAAMYAMGDLERSEWLSARSRLSISIEKAESATRTQIRQAIKAELPTNLLELIKYWEGLTLPRRRALLDAILEAVIIQPVGKGGNIVKTDRIVIKWRL